jgi:hypothetical protein
VLGDTVLQVLKSNQIDRWNISEGPAVPKSFYLLASRSEKIVSGLVTPNLKYIIASKDNHTLSVWDLPEKVTWFPKLLYTTVAIDSFDYLTRIPSGYYQGTVNAARQSYYVTKKLQVINFEQLDIKYNRPDLVLTAIGNKDTALINSYQRAYFKRIKKLGIDTASFRGDYSVPESDFKNRDSIDFEQTKESLRLSIKGFDNTYILDRFNVWVNEVPLFGQKGISIRWRNSAGQASRPRAGLPSP